MESYLMEKSNLKLVGGPVDLNAAALVGARVPLKNAERVAFIVALAAGTGSTAQFTLRQHNAASAGTSKDIVSSNPVYVKAGAATVFTKIDQSAVPAAMTDLSTQFGTDGGLAVFECLAEDLDVNGGFTHVSLDAADAATAKLGVILAVVRDAKNGPAYEVSI